MGDDSRPSSKGTHASSAANVAMDGGATAAESKARHEETHRFTDFIVDHPFGMIGICLVAILFTAFIWTSVQTTSDTGGEGGNFFAIDEIEVRRYYTFAKSEQNEDVTPVPQLSETENQLIMDVYFSTTDAGRGEGQIFTRDNLLKIFDTEVQIAGRPGLADPANRRSKVIDGFEDNCLTDYSTNATGALQVDGCAPATSVLTSVIFPGAASVTRAMIEALSQADIDAALLAGSTDEKLSGGNDFFFAVDFRGANDTAGPRLQSWITRSTVRFGVPLKSRDGATINGTFVSEEFPFYVDENDNAQLDRHEDWVEQYFDFYDARDPEGVEVNYIELVLSNLEISKIVEGDFVLVGLAAVLIYVLLIFGTGSAFLGTMGLLSIVGALPPAMMVYHLLFEFTTTFNQLALYVILGIGADDVFVVVEAWAQLRAEGESGTDVWSLHSRMWHTWRRAASAMIATTATTFAAFMMTATSPQPGIAVFGVLAGLLVVFVYINTITLFPACILIFELYLRDLRWFGWCRSKPAAVADEEQPPAAAREAVEMDAKGGGAAAAGQDAGAADDGPRASEQSVSRSARHTADVDVSAHGRLDQFYYTRLAPFLYRYRYQLVALMSCVYVLGVVGFSQLEVPEDLDFPLPDGSDLGRALDLADEEFPPSQQAQSNHQVGMFWGMNPDRPISREGLDWNDLDNFGKYIFDDGFVFDNATQTYVVGVCERLRARTAPDGRAYATKVECLPQLLKEWEAATNFSDPALKSYDATWDGDPNNLSYDPVMVSLRLQDFFEYEDPATGTLSNRQYRKNVGGILGVPADELEGVKWVRILIDTTLTLRYKRTEQDFWFDAWADEMTELNADPGTPEPARKGMQASMVWAQKVSNDRLVESTYVSVFSSFAIAIVIMLLVTGNLPVTLLASLSLLGTVMTSMGLFVALGRKLGIVESVVSQVLVGLAVDYVVHLAHSYNSCELAGRFNRGRAAVFEILPAISLGLITTVSAAIVLQFAVLSFFVQFGEFIMAALLLSIAYAVFFFMPLAMIVAPKQLPEGNVSHLWRTRCGTRPDPAAGDAAKGGGAVEAKSSPREV